MKQLWRILSAGTADGFFIVDLDDKADAADDVPVLAIAFLHEQRQYPRHLTLD